MAVAGAADPAVLFADVVRRAEGALEQAFGGRVRLDGVRRLTGEGRRNLLLRCAVAQAPAGAPASVVIKRARQDGYDPDDPGSDAARGLLRDWAGLELLAAVPTADVGAPAFYAGDRAAGLVVMEDLGEGRDLARVLLAGDAQEAATSLVSFAATLGRLHGATVGQRERYRRICRALGREDDPAADEGRHLREAAEPLAEACAQAGVTVGPSWRDDVGRVAAAIEDPGPFLAYTTGDPCPDNALYAAGRVRVFDFEHGGFRHALREGCYGRIRFPTCWCVGDIPEAVVERMDAAYRTELARGCPEAADDRLYQGAVADACAFWLLDNLRHMLSRCLDHDDQWGIATLRERLVVRLAAFGRAAARARRTDALTAMAADLLDRLRRRWELALPPYTAFGAPPPPATGDAAALVAAIGARDAAGLDALLERDPALAAARLPDGDPEPALHRAARAGDAGLVTRLLAAGAPPDARDPWRQTALALAASAGAEGVVAALLAGGADPRATDLGGRTALLRALEAGQTAVAAQLVVAGAPVDAFAAARGGDAVRLEALLAADPGAARHRLPGGLTPLHLAVDHDAPGPVIAVLAAAGADPAATTGWGGTALHVAAARGCVAGIAPLLAAGASLEAETDWGATALHLAAEHGHAATVRALLAAGADAQARTHDGRRPGDLAQAGGHDDAAALLAPGTGP